MADNNRDNASRFQELIKRTNIRSQYSARQQLYTNYPHPLTELNIAQKLVLQTQVDKLESLLRHHPDQAVAIFYFAIPAIMWAQWYAAPEGTAPEKAGTEAVLKFIEQVEAGRNVWAASIATVTHPEKFFLRLMADFDRNQGFAFWTVNPEKAAQDLWAATRGNPLWDTGETSYYSPGNEYIKAWKTKILTPVSKLQEAASFDLKAFALSKDGYAVGSEIEVRNAHSDSHYPPDNELYSLIHIPRHALGIEKTTPHTTDLESFADYLRGVKQNFIDAKDFLPPHYFWNMHLNLSLSKKAASNFPFFETTKSFTNGHTRSIALKNKELEKIGNMLFFPANPYMRNIYLMQESPNRDSGEVYYKSHPNIIDPRCPEREDAGHLEFKCCSAGPEMDVDYLMGCLKIMHLLTEHPEKLPKFKRELHKWYGSLIKPGEFASERLPAEDDVDSIQKMYDARSEKYQDQSKKFREEMKTRFSKIGAEFESPAPSDFQQRLANKDNPPRLR